MMQPGNSQPFHVRGRPNSGRPSRWMCTLATGNPPTLRGPAAHDPRVAVDYRDAGPLVRRHPLPMWKRSLDLACCLIALPFLGILTVVMGLILKVTSPGPLLFTQERVGFEGRRFKIYKFRTMFVGADTTAHQAHLESVLRSNSPMVKLDSTGDARLVTGGRMLRATGLDELPQIINVFLAEMSIVGPRPCLPYEYTTYQPWQKERFNAMPGLTGLWQVSGKNRTTFDEMIRLDIRYSRLKSPWTDVSIILKTVPALVVQVSDSRKKAALNSRQRQVPVRVL